MIQPARKFGQGPSSGRDEKLITNLNQAYGLFRMTKWVGKICGN